MPAQRPTPIFGVVTHYLLPGLTPACTVDHAVSSTTVPDMVNCPDCLASQGWD